MTIRAAMCAACEERIVAYRRQCGGCVQLTAEHWANAAGADETSRRLDLLSEAGIGCCQKCGCLSATVMFASQNGTEYAIARCNDDPGVRALGDRNAPEPGRMK